MIYNKNPETFWNKIDIRRLEDCWPYKNGSSRYPYIKINGKSYPAHRIAWELSNNTTIPEGMYILHKCDNKRCCNPNHLYCGTPQDNMRDRWNRNPTPAEIIGIGGVKLSADEIVEIRNLHQDGPCGRHKISMQKVGSMYGVNWSTIRNIWNNSKYLCKEGYYI